MKTQIFALAVVMLLSLLARGADYTWTAGGGAGNTLWSTPTNWGSLTYPQGGDAAIFTGTTERTVTVGTGTQSVYGVIFSGQANWTWQASGGNDLFVGAGGFTYNTLRRTYAGSIGYSTIYSSLSGAAPVVNNGRLRLMHGTNTFTGTIQVSNGALLGATNGSFGNVANDIVLGATGSFGGLGIQGGSGKRATLDRKVTLAGNGGILVSGGNAPIGINGLVTGPGKLIVMTGVANAEGNHGWLYQDNDYSGGTLVVSGSLRPATGSENKAVFGTGDIRILNNGVLIICGSNNVAAGATVLVADQGYGGGLQFAGDYLPKIDPASSGTLILETTAYANGNLDKAFSSTTTPIGNGQMYLGAAGAASYYGSSLAALVANDPTHTYKFGGGLNANLQVGASRASGGVLTNLNGQSHNVVAGKPGIWGENFTQRVRLTDANSYSGETTVNRGTTLLAYGQQNGSGLGAASGGVTLNGYGNNSHSNASLWYMAYKNKGTDNQYGNDRKAKLTLNGGTYIVLDHNPSSSEGGAADNQVKLTFDALVRKGRATMGLRATNLNVREQFMITGGQATSHGMVAPYFWDTLNNAFLDYDANGFKTTTVQVASLSGAAATAIVHSAGEAVASGGQKIWALRAAGAMTAASPGDVLTVDSGGIVFAAAATHTAPFQFGSAEGLIYTPLATTLNGQISGSGGLTKSGVADLTLGADNSATLSGDITVNHGYLKVAGDNNIGSGKVVLNGGGLWCTTGGGTFTRDIELGDVGGYLNASDSTIYSGDISGSGSLWLTTAGQNLILAGNNTYSGGTYLNASKTLVVTNNSSLGSGDVYLGAGNGTSDLNANSLRLHLLGDDNLSPDARLYLKTQNAVVLVKGPTSTKIGSLEGVGVIMLGKGENHLVQNGGANNLSVGWNDLDTEFFGSIVDGNIATPSSVTKVGSGTLTLWGENTYGGGTTVEEGTLLVNNWLNTAGMVMVVGEDARLGGIGTVGSVAVDGSGTLAPGMSAGTFTVYGLEMEKSTLEIEIEGDVASGLYDKLVVYGGVKLNKTSEEEGTRLLLKLGGYEPVLDGQWYTIIENDQMDAVAGGFWNAPNELDTFLDESGQYLFEITYLGGDGNDVAVRLIPEPGTLWLLMVSMLGGLLLRRARRG